MVNEWKALERVGEWAGLDGSDLDEYVLLVSDIYNSKVGDYGEFKNYREDYFEFLNNRILTDERVVNLLISKEVEDSTIEKFKNGSVPIEKTFHSESILEYGLDELVDLIMMLKLVWRYTELTNQECLTSRYRFQKILYLTNLELKETETGSVDNSNFGLLETTGYRYSFTKRSSGPFSRGAYLDKDRLYASNLIEEEVIDDNGTGEVAEREHTYGIKLSYKGKMMLQRYRNIIHKFESEILGDWDWAQEDAISKIVGKSTKEIQSYITDETDVESLDWGKHYCRQDRLDLVPICQMDLRMGW